MLFVAILSMVGGGAKSLFRNESSFQTGESSSARIRDTALTLLRIYVVLTAICMFGLRGLGMSWFDAVNHAFTCVATGGFSASELRSNGADHVFDDFSDVDAVISGVSTQGRSIERKCD